MKGQTVSTTVDKAPEGFLTLEDQNGNIVGGWHPDMAAFDRLPQSVREYMTQMVNPPPARNVEFAVKNFGATVALQELRAINMEDALMARVG